MVSIGPASSGPLAAADLQSGRRAGAANSADDRKAASPEGLSEDEQRAVAQLKKRDAEVRAHEQAHAAAGGSHAGAPSYQTERGPDGRTYAVGGEVAIDVSPAGSPSATIAKADQITRAALAPADPSSQDLAVAAAAQQMRAEAQAELIRTQAAELSGNDGAAGDPSADSETPPAGSASADRQLAGARAYSDAAGLFAAVAATA